ncbi:hypothetical protein BJV78DRAFT_1270135, partial [Lactifluus subvellereus]
MLLVILLLIRTSTYIYTLTLWLTGSARMVWVSFFLPRRAYTPRSSSHNFLRVSLPSIIRFILAFPLWCMSSRINHVFSSP